MMTNILKHSEMESCGGNNSFVATLIQTDRDTHRLRCISHRDRAPLPPCQKKPRSQSWPFVPSQKERVTETGWILMTLKPLHEIQEKKPL